MNVLAIIAALTSGLLGEPHARASGVDGPSADSIDAGDDRAELEAAVSWFLTAVAEPVLKATGPAELRRLLTVHAKVAVEARSAIATAVASWLKSDPGAMALEPDAALRSTLLARNPDLLRLLEVTTADTRDLFTMIKQRRTSSVEMAEAMSTLTPVATDADVLLMLAIVAALRDDVEPAIQRAVSELASANVLRHRAQLHAMLRRWDPTWTPTIDAPGWADDPEPLDLSAEEVAVVAQLFHDPPAPNAALRRALARR
jgi:hypothetical protein